MIIVHASMNAKPGQRDKLIEALRPCVDATRKEDGCISYSLFAKTEDEIGLMFVEQWESKDALRKHLATDHFKRMKEDRMPYAADGDNPIVLFEAKQESL
ncbi:MAG: antibiotic biosynthesis monooxygenase [Synergistaceae bacterium]|jgi:quinol monooxygenase YgiN|nr:antibiotic biosynthesis monooxygenase [Synergistaceae bacterium]